MFIGTKLTKLSNTIAFIEQILNKKDKNAFTTDSDGMFFVSARKKKAIISIRVPTVVRPDWFRLPDQSPRQGGGARVGQTCIRRRRRRGTAGGLEKWGRKTLIHENI